jgi:3-deoxy-D-manno-octulosonic-acid transferase
MTQKRHKIIKGVFYWLYQAGISFYAFIAGISSVFNKKARLMIKGQAEAFDIITKKKIENQTYVWFHAASLGEFEQGRPVMEALKRKDPTANILLTFFSPSGYEIRKNYSEADIIVYLPFDTQRNAEKLLNIIPVTKAIFIKYEFWPNYLNSLKIRNIPVYSISAIFRQEQIFFKPYGKWYLGQLHNFNHIFVQDEESLKLLQQHNIQQVSVAGDTRFDRVLEIAEQAKQLPLIEKFVAQSDFTLVAGSTWPADEALLIRWMQEHPESKLILVPHEIHESHILSITSRTGKLAIRYTEAEEATVHSYRCLILDTMGMLSSVYQYGNLAYVGGGFGVGIHNILEAAVWGIPVIFGPNYLKFREAEELIQLEVSISVSDYAQLIEAINQLIKKREVGKKARNYVNLNAGATKNITALIWPGT